jgi:pilus assembly protein Flp/PilA
LLKALRCNTFHALNGKEVKKLAKIKHFLRDESGATAIEYGLIASLIVIAAMGAINSFAGTTISMWMGVSSTVGNVASGATGG